MHGLGGFDGLLDHNLFDVGAGIQDFVSIQGDILPYNHFLNDSGFKCLDGSFDTKCVLVGILVDLVHEIGNELFFPYERDVGKEVTCQIDGLANNKKSFI